MVCDAPVVRLQARCMVGRPTRTVSVAWTDKPTTPKRRPGLNWDEIELPELDRDGIRSMQIANDSVAF